jgi:hypothetical protein
MPSERLGGVGYRKEEGTGLGQSVLEAILADMGT